MSATHGSFTCQRGAFHAYKYLVDSFEDGAALCKVVNALEEGAIEHFNKGGKLNNFKKMENVGFFLEFAQSRVGLMEDEVFTQHDLVEHRNLVEIVKGLKTFANKVHEMGLTEIAIEEVGASHEFSDKEIQAAAMALAAEETEMPEDSAAAEPHHSDIAAVGELLHKILIHEGGSMSISLLGHCFLQETGVSWKKNFKRRGFAPFPEFLASLPDLFEIDGQTITAQED